jgi:hypothetical protein
MITAAQTASVPAALFQPQTLAAGRERSTQSRSPLQLLSGLCERLTASTRCMQFAALVAAALLSAEAWGVCSAIATRAASPVSTRPCELWSTDALRCVELPTSLLPPGERLAYASRAYRNRRVSGATALRAR